MSDLVKTPERLKQSILQEAMQGKLTKQLPSDGDARFQLNNIIDGKNVLIKKLHVRTNNKRYKPITEAPYKIPQSWSWVRLHEICELLNGRTYKRNELLTNSSLTPVLRVGNLFTNKKWYYSNLQLPERHYVNHGDLIYAWSASFGPRIWNGPRAIFHMHIWKILMSTKYLDKYFMYYLLLDITKLVKSESHGISMKHITKTKMNDIPLPLPPLAEQHRIVQRLNEILPKVDDLNKDVIKLDQIRTKFPHRLKQSLLLEAMKGHLTYQLPSDGNADDLLQSIQQKKQQLIRAGKIRKHKKLPPISKDEIPFKIPKNWKWVRIGSIFHENGQKTPDSDSKYIDIKSINNKTHDIQHVRDITARNAPSRARKLCQKGNVIYSTTRPYLHNVAIIKEVPSCDLFASTAYVVMNTLLNGYYLLYVLLSPLFDKQVMNKSTGTTYPAINNTNFKKLLIPLPPLAEQYRIIDKLRNIFSKL